MEGHDDRPAIPQFIDGRELRRHPGIGMTTLNRLTVSRESIATPSLRFHLSTCTRDCGAFGCAASQEPC